MRNPIAMAWQWNKKQRQKQKREELSGYYSRLPKFYFILPSPEMAHPNELTQNQIDASPTLRLLATRIDGSEPDTLNLRDSLVVVKQQWLERGRWWSVVLASAWSVGVLIYPFALFFIPGGYSVTSGVSPIQTIPIAAFGLIGLLSCAVRIHNRRTMRILSRTLLPVVPALYALVNVQLTKEWGSSVASNGRVIKYLEKTAKYLEQIPLSLPRRSESARDQIGVMAYRKAAYVRNLKMYVLVPTPLSQNDLLHELSEFIRITLEDGWQHLPEAEPEINRALNRLQRAGLIIIAALLIAALVSIGFLNSHLGYAGAPLSFVIGLVLVYLLGKLNIAVSSLTQASDVASKLSRQGDK